MFKSKEQEPVVLNTIIRISGKYNFLSAMLNYHFQSSGIFLKIRDSIFWVWCHWEYFYSAPVPYLPTCLKWHIFGILILSNTSSISYDIFMDLKWYFCIINLEFISGVQYGPERLWVAFSKLFLPLGFEQVSISKRTENCLNQNENYPCKIRVF